MELVEALQPTQLAVALSTFPVHKVTFDIVEGGHTYHALVVVFRGWAFASVHLSSHLLGGSLFFDDVLESGEKVDLSGA